MVYQGLRHVLEGLQGFILPPTCIACGGPGQPPHLDLCTDCAAELPLNTSACGRCGVALVDEAGGLICGACLREPPFFDASFCAYRYAYPIDHFIRGLKYAQALAHAQVLGKLLGGLLAQQLRERNAPWPECFIPVPLSAQRFRERGYNQAIELGRFVERAIGVPMRTDLVTRPRHTVEQASLPRTQRRKNMRGAFSIFSKTLPSHIAILDDVVTTGSTVNELARVLLLAGVEHVQVWAVARTSGT